MEGHLHGGEGVTVTMGQGLGSAGQFEEGVGTGVEPGEHRSKPGLGRQETCAFQEDQKPPPPISLTSLPTMS